MSEGLFLTFCLLLPFLSAAALWFFARHIRRTKATGAGRLVLGNLLVLLFLLSLLFAAGECYVRFFYDTTDSLDYTKVSRRWFKRHWQLNKAGCRDNIEYSYRRDPHRRRISFLGDSFTVAQGVKDVEDRFANRIRRKHPEWDIQVLAELGMDTGDELNFLQRLFSNGYQPDDVVLVYCLNDVSDMMPEWHQAAQRIFTEAAQGNWLLRDSYLVNTLYHRLRAAHDPYMSHYFEFVRGSYRGALWEQQKERLKALRDLVQTNGGRLSVVTFPFLHALGPNYEFQFMHDELDQLWRDLHVPHLDLLPIYKDLPAKTLVVGKFDAHPNEYANALAATAIEKFLNHARSRTMAEVLAASQPGDWRPLDPEKTLYLELAAGRIVIELAPDFAPHHVANVKALAREHYFDGLAVVRCQDNYVVQWADPNAEKPELKKPIQHAQATLAPEFDRELDPKLPFTQLPDGDVYAPEVGFCGGFPVARDSKAGKMWLVHCYGMVGAGRDVKPDTGGGIELYVVIGQAPRHLDRNVTLLGRVVQGMELLSALPRGTGALGFYEKPEQRVPIKSLRVAADVPPSEQSNIEVMRTDTALFQELIESRRNRREDWFVRPAGHIELCNVPIPVRVAGGAGGH
jgi:peptidylprolyl isomerase